MSSGKQPFDSMWRGSATASICVGFALALLVAGLAVGWRAWSHRPVLEATVGGLHLEMQQSRWLLNQMDHGSVYSMPASMTPDLPDHELEHRLSVEFSITNRSPVAQRFDLEDFVLLRLDTDQYPEAVRFYAVSAMPTLLVLDGEGRERQRFEGIQDAEEFAQHLVKLAGDGQGR